MTRHADEDQSAESMDWLLAPMVPPEPSDEELPGETVYVSA